MGIILPDGVISAEADPVGDGAVLLHLLSQNALGSEGFQRRLNILISGSKQRSS